MNTNDIYTLEQRKHAYRMRNVYSMIQKRGHERCFRIKCENYIMDLNRCICELELIYGPHDLREVYYCCRECYDLGPEGEDSFIQNIVCK
jgi:hypothetical protein